MCLYTATSVYPVSLLKSQPPSEESGVGKRKKRKRSALDAQHPPTTEMVMDALLTLDDKKGATIKVGRANGGCCCYCFTHAHTDNVLSD